MLVVCILPLPRGRYRGVGLIHPGVGVDCRTTVVILRDVVYVACDIILMLLRLVSVQLGYTADISSIH